MDVALINPDVDGEFSTLDDAFLFFFFHQKQSAFAEVGRQSMPTSDHVIVNEDGSCLNALANFAVNCCY